MFDDKFDQSVVPTEVDAGRVYIASKKYYGANKPSGQNHHR